MHVSIAIGAWVYWHYNLSTHLLISDAYDIKKGYTKNFQKLALLACRKSCAQRDVMLHTYYISTVNDKS